MSLPSIQLITNGQQHELTSDALLSHAVLVPSEIARFADQQVVFLEELLATQDPDSGVRCMSRRGEAYSFLGRDKGNFSLLSTNTPSWKLVPAGRDQLAEVTTPRFVLREVAVIEIGVDATMESVSDEVFTNLTDALAKPTDVRFLNLTSANIETFPIGILELTNIESLNLGKNKIETIPPEICDLHKLEVLKLSRNRLKTLPNEIGRLKQLTELHASYNEIESLGDKIWNLGQLELLNLGNNKIRSIPDEIKSLSNLREMELDANPIPPEERDRIQQLIPHTKIEW
ncbi:MAG: leucine-rich repeat domain-containing protein [Aeoliella sp.]